MTQPFPTQYEIIVIINPNKCRKITSDQQNTHSNSFPTQRRTNQSRHPLQIQRLLPVRLRRLHLMRSYPSQSIRKCIRLLTPLQLNRSQLQSSQEKVAQVRRLSIERVVRGDEEDLRSTERSCLTYYLTIFGTI